MPTCRTIEHFTVFSKEAFQKGGRIYQQTQTQIDNLTAQLMAADESMLQAKDEISKLKRERDAAGADATKYKNLLPVLKAQVRHVIIKRIYC